MTAPYDWRLERDYRRAVRVFALVVGTIGALIVATLAVWLLVARGSGAGWVLLAVAAAMAGTVAALEHTEIGS